MAELKHDYLKQAFENAKEWKLERTLLRGSGDEGWEHAKTDFEKGKSDIMLEFDQNLNTKEVSEEDEKKIRFVMQVVQQQATNSFANKGDDFTRDPELWIAFFARYPLLFNFKLRESKVFNKKNFSLSTDPDLINDCLGSGTPKDVAAAFVKALQRASGQAHQTEGCSDFEFAAPFLLQKHCQTVYMDRKEPQKVRGVSILLIFFS